MKMIVTFKLAPLLILVLLFFARCEKGTYYAADGDGNLYDTVTIGTQVWLKDNLKTTKSITGLSIQLVTDRFEWASMQKAAYCWYDNVSNNYKDTYGALYNGYAVQYVDLCPVGFHVATREDWSVLINYLGGDANKLKESGFVHWLEGNDGATNESRFTALPGGARSEDGSFEGLGHYGWWWSSTSGNESAYYFMLRDVSNNASIRYYTRMSNGFSVRCVQD